MSILKLQYTSTTMYSRNHIDLPGTVYTVRTYMGAASLGYGKIGQIERARTGTYYTLCLHTTIKTIYDICVRKKLGTARART